MTGVQSTAAAPLSEQAYLAIRDRIVSLQLRPGAVVNEKELIESLGIGRTPVREALRRLAQQQLVEVYPRRGMFVTTVEIRDLASLCEVRSVLESHAAHLAGTRATAAEVEELDGLVRVLRASAEADQRTLMELDEHVHQAIWRAAHNPFLASTLEEYFVHALRIWHLALDRTSDLGSAVHSNIPVLRAITSGRADEAARLMRKHVDDFEKSMRRALLDR